MKKKLKDVTAKVKFGNPDDEALPLYQCVCGATYAPWKVILSIYEDDPHDMPCCGRRLYFQQRIMVLEATTKAGGQ